MSGSQWIWSIFWMRQEYTMDGTAVDRKSTMNSQIHTHFHTYRQFILANPLNGMFYNVGGNRRTRETQADTGRTCEQ